MITSIQSLFTAAHILIYICNSVSDWDELRKGIAWTKTTSSDLSMDQGESEKKKKGKVDRLPQGEQQGTSRLASTAPGSDEVFVTSSYCYLITHDLSAFLCIPLAPPEPSPLLMETIFVCILGGF
jgi:hypothetical protein